MEMSVLIETSVGELVIDLFTESAVACTNFIKLCKLGYYKGKKVFQLQKDFIVHFDSTLSPSLYGQLGGPSSFPMEKHPKFKHSCRGTVAMVPMGGTPPRHATAFYITLRDRIEYLDGTCSVIGKVVEGLDTLDVINECFTDHMQKPLLEIKILAVDVLYDPFDDLEGMDQIVYKEEIVMEEEEEDEKHREMRNKARVLEVMGDLPHADVKPPENVLFVCKLNAATRAEDLEIIFSRFGEIRDCTIIRDWKTGKSLQYAFIEFERQEDCERAYVKMKNVVIDDRRIHVDFSQSVSGLWNKSFRERQHNRKRHR